MGEYTYMSATPLHTEDLAHQKQWTCLVILYIKNDHFLKSGGDTLKRNRLCFSCGDRRTQDETVILLNRTKSERSPMP